MANFSDLHNVAKAASGMSISSQVVSVRFLQREGCYSQFTIAASKKFTTKQREKGSD